MALFVAGAAVVGYFAYRAYGLTMKSIYAERPTRPGEIGAIAGYQDIGNAYVDPRNTISNPQNLRLVRQEEGEFGCPRLIYEGGDRGSNIVTYGFNYNKF